MTLHWHHRCLTPDPRHVSLTVQDNPEYGFLFEGDGSAYYRYSLYCGLSASAAAAHPVGHPQPHEQQQAPPQQEGAAQHQQQPQHPQFPGYDQQQQVGTLIVKCQSRVCAACSRSLCLAVQQC